MEIQDRAHQHRRMAALGVVTSTIIVTVEIDK